MKTLIEVSAVFLFLIKKVISSSFVPFSGLESQIIETSGLENEFQYIPVSLEPALELAVWS